MLLNTVALLLGVELILLYSGLADGAITNFQCTDGPVCAGDRIECSCTTDSGTLHWDISYSPVDHVMWSQIPSVVFHKSNNEEYRYGYNFTFNTTYTGLNTSILTFNLNQSESVFIECANGEEIDKMNTTVTDLGYYAKAPTNLTTVSTTSGVTLQWEDIDNNCASTEYQVTIISCSCTSTSVLMYNTSNTALHINSSDLSENVPYTYTVRGWNEQLSNNSKPFTLDNTTNTTDPCKNNICCVGDTLNSVLVPSDTCSKHPSQYYNNSITGNIPVTESKIDNSDTYYVSSTQKTNFSPSNDPMTSQSPGNGETNNSGQTTRIIIGSSVGGGGLIIICLVGIICLVCIYCQRNKIKRLCQERMNTGVDVAEDTEMTRPRTDSAE